MEKLSLGRISRADAELLVKEFGKMDEWQTEVERSVGVVEISLTGNAKILKAFTSRNRRLKRTLHTHYLCVTSRETADMLFSRVCGVGKCRWRFVELLSGVSA